MGKNHSPSESKYTTRLNELFSDPIFWKSFFEVANCVGSYLELAAADMHHSEIKGSKAEDLMKFCVLCLESIVYLITKCSNSENRLVIETNYIESALICANSAFKMNVISNVLGLDCHVSWLCSSINSIYILVNYFLLNFEPLPVLSTFGLEKSFENNETESAANACNQISIMVAWLEQLQKKPVHNISETIFILIKSIIISLARLPLVNSYVLTPPDVWEQRWQTDLTGKYHTQVPPMPIEYLQEIEVLEQFTFRYVQNVCSVILIISALNVR